MTETLAGLRCGHQLIANASVDILIKAIPSQLETLIAKECDVQSRCTQDHRAGLLSAPSFVSIIGTVLDTSAADLSPLDVAQRLANSNVCYEC